MSIPVLTRAYSNGRGGANIEESVLTAAAVRSRGIKRLFSLQLAGDARGVEAQPLIVPGVKLPGGQTRDLVLLATMANQIVSGAPFAPRYRYTPFRPPISWCITVSI